MSQAYLRPGSDRPVAETEVKRSRFIACAARVPDEDAARAFLAEIRAEFADARHHCSAYILHVDGANPVERSSDDGEPAGTAGQPMLEVLRGSGLQDVAVVVVRYFGGVKLGTGGLVRAYQDATRAVLEVARRTCSGKVVSALEGGYDLEGLGRSAVAHVAALGED